MILNFKLLSVISRFNLRHVRTKNLFFLNAIIYWECNNTKYLIRTKIFLNIKFIQLTAVINSTNSILITKFSEGDNLFSVFLHAFHL